MDDERVPEPRAWRPFPLFFDNPRVSMDVWRRCLDFTATPTVRGWLRELLCVVAFGWAWWRVMIFVAYSAARHRLEFPEAVTGPA